MVQESGLVCRVCGTVMIKKLNFVMNVEIS